MSKISIKHALTGNMETVEINNTEFDIELFNENSVFICAIGYETRSHYLLDKVAQKITASQILIFLFDDYDKSKRESLPMLTTEAVSIITVNYNDSEKVQTSIREFIRNTRDSMDSDHIVVHIDYSSMPRSWYCRLPLTMKNLLETKERAFFWYVEGEYPRLVKNYPTAGIDDNYSVFAGKSSLRTNKKRMHLFALGYDTIRTQATISMLDPEGYIACVAYNSKHREMLDAINKANAHIFSQAYMSLILPLEDFEFMLSKLCEIAYEFCPSGDVIFVPDGPKPLILAVSLVPEYVNQEGIVCLHFSRNPHNFERIDVQPTDNILGFSLEKYQ